MDDVQLRNYLVERIRTISDINVIDEIYAHACETSQEIGFKYWQCAPISPIIPNIRKHGIGNLPINFLKKYIEEGIKVVDPFILIFQKANRPVIAHTIDFSKISPSQSMLDFSDNEGIVDFVAFSIHGANNYCGVVTWCSQKTIDISDTALKHLSLYSTMLHNSFEDILSDEFRHKEKEIKISLRAREVMEWVAQGKSNHEIGMILGLSENTVKFHIKKTCSELGVNSRIQAALKCLYC